MKYFAWAMVALTICLTSITVACWYCTFHLVSTLDGRTNYMYEASLRHEIMIGEIQRQLERKVGFEKRVEWFRNAVDFVVIPQFKEVPETVDSYKNPKPFSDNVEQSL